MHLLILPPYIEFISFSSSGYSNLLPVALLIYFVSILPLVSEMCVTPVLFEQPVHRDDWEGLRDVSIVAMEKYKVAVAADESCRSLLDAQKIINGNLAHVINIKLAKLGVLGALEIIDAARKANVALMIGGMVETRIAMGFAGHLAAGLGCFRFVCCESMKSFFLHCA
jgi:L-alanine-DL-glutamate epimerase-like enolase superfamily enzyme